MTGPQHDDTLTWHRRHPLAQDQQALIELIGDDDSDTGSDGGDDEADVCRACGMEDAVDSEDEREKAAESAPPSMVATTTTTTAAS